MVFQLLNNLRFELGCQWVGFEGFRFFEDPVIVNYSYQHAFRLLYIKWQHKGQRKMQLKMMED